MTSSAPLNDENAALAERLSFTLQAAEIGTWDYNLETGVAEWSSICKELFGIPPDAHVTASLLLERVHPDDREWVNQANIKAVSPNTDGIHNITFRTLTGQGGYRWVQAKGRTYRNKQGGIQRFAGIVQDVTSSIEARQQLLASQERFRNLIEEAPIATCLFLGRDMVVDVANSIMLSYWGKDSSVLGKPLAEAVPELVGQPFLQILNEVFTSGQTYESKNAPAYLVMNGVPGIYYFDFTFKPLRNAQGEVYAVLDMAVDVTQQYQAQQRVEAAQRQVLISFEQSPVAIAIISRENLTFQMANPFYGQLVGRTPEQLVGKPLLEVMTELRGQGFDQLLRDVMDTGIPYNAKEVPVTVDRHNQLETIYVDLTYQPWQDTDGQSGPASINGVLVVATDVTEQVLSRKAIEASEAKLRSVIATAPAAMGLFIGRDLIVEMPNQAFIDIVGKGPNISGKPLREVMPELVTENQPFLHILDDVYTSGKTFQTYGSLVKIVRNGVMTHNYYNFTYSPLLDADDRVYAILDIAIDVTEGIKARQETEESEARYRALSEELESRVQQRTQEVVQANQDLKRSNENLQQFAYIASHDLQEPLRKIQSFSTLLKEQFGDELGEGGQDLLQRMSSAGARMSTLIKDLLAYSRISTRQQIFGLVSLNAILANVLNTLEWDIQQREARIEVDDLPTIKGDESQLGQLFQNLLSNALKFTPAGKAPQIQVRCCRLNANELPTDAKLTSQASLLYQISVSDQGIGFDTKYLDRIFQVFQRLHGRNEFPGTGVGLAICQRVVENHGGAITATSRPNEGATFCVYLPS
ncbi:PAS domain-containing sensor histidine kinase [Spirosoma sp.]|uniref:PAS domain-containing sensor histidine kinase n=1 Tax=Spirosoma sp. TaxID=1899569 RepID=UPI003B3A0257